MAAGTKLHVYVALVSAAFVAGLASGRVEPVVLAAPLALAVAVGLAAAGPAAVELGVELAHARITEGDTVALDVTVSDRRAHRTWSWQSTSPPGSQSRNRDPPGAWRCVPVSNAGSASPFRPGGGAAMSWATSSSRPAALSGY